MKLLVHFIQAVLIMGIIYPVYLVWENDRVSNFCVEVNSTMSKQEFLDLAEQKNIKVEIDNADGLKWFATFKIPSMFSNDFCSVSGLGDRIGSAKLVSK